MTKVKEFMHPGAETLPPDATISKIAQIMKDKDVGAVPIVDKGAIVGMVTDRDITVRALADGGDLSKLTAKDIMTKDIACCAEGDTAQSASQIMQSKRIRRLPVLSKDKKIVGIVSLGDLTRAMPDEASGRLAKAVSAHHV
jgi:CBS domain-containing protein